MNLALWLQRPLSAQRRPLLAVLAGVEPATTRLTVVRSTVELQDNGLVPWIVKVPVLAGPVRVELTSPGSEPGVLPLDHRPMLVAPPGIEPGVAVCNTAALPLGHGAMLAESTGFEPASPLRLPD